MEEQKENGKLAGKSISVDDCESIYRLPRTLISQYVIPDTDIFDLEITEKFRKLFSETQDLFSKDKYYKLQVQFHINNLVSASDKMQENAG